jgi:hypothetical protein
MKKLVRQLKQTKSCQERVKLAENKQPGTAFDYIFERAQEAKQFEKLHPNITREHLYRLGLHLANAILRGDSKTLHDMADALRIWNTWQHRRPETDKALVVMLSLTGMFRKGWRKRWVTLDEKTGRVIRVGLPPGREKVAMRDIEANLRRLDPTMTKVQWLAIKRKIQRWKHLYHIPLDETAGRPLKK